MCNESHYTHCHVEHQAGEVLGQHVYHQLMRYNQLIKEDLPERLREVEHTLGGVKGKVDMHEEMLKRQEEKSKRMEEQLEQVISQTAGERISQLACNVFTRLHVYKDPGIVNGV